MSDVWHYQDPLDWAWLPDQCEYGQGVEIKEEWARIRELQLTPAVAIECSSSHVRWSARAKAYRYDLIAHSAQETARVAQAMARNWREIPYCVYGGVKRIELRCGNAYLFCSCGDEDE